MKELYGLIDDHIHQYENGTISEISDKALRQRLKDGNWDYDDDAGTLMRFDNIRDMFTNTIVKDGQKYLVVDVARYGRDKTVFNFWDRLERYKREKYQGIGTDKTIQLNRDFASTEKIPFSQILVDEDGVSGGVVDHGPRKVDQWNSDDRWQAVSLSGTVDCRCHCVQCA